MLSLLKYLNLLDRWDDSDSSNSAKFTLRRHPKIRRDEYLVTLTP